MQAYLSFDEIFEDAKFQLGDGKVGYEGGIFPPPAP
jgi:hypothetical protein